MMKIDLRSFLPAGLIAAVIALGGTLCADTPADTVKIEKKADLAKGVFKEIRHVAVANGDIYVCGDNSVKIFSADGKELAGWQTAAPALCAAVDKAGFVYTVTPDKIVKYSNDRKGVVVTAFGSAGKAYGQLSNPSGISCFGNSVLVTDAGNSCIHRYTAEGKFVEDIGRAMMAKRGSFSTCCGILDAAVAKDGRIYVANLGAHRVEIYQNGRRQSFFGKAGDKPDDFCGCCNPTNITLASDGRIITTEKTIPRIKIFSPDGKKMLALIGADNFNSNCFNMYVAVDAKNNIYAVDNAGNCVRVFAFSK